MKRKAVSTRLRFDVFKRDRFTCQYCGKTPPHVILHVDHIVPVVEGGDNDQTNLTTACSECNLGKSGIGLHVVPTSLADQAADAAERRAQVEAHAAMLQEAREAFEGWCWDVADTLQENASQGYSSANLRSIKMFVKRLGFPQTMEAAQVAADRWGEGSRRFRYFCGVCWRMIGEAESS